MKKQLLTMALTLGCVLTIPTISYAEDYSYLDDMTINQLKALDEEIHKRIPLNNTTINEVETGIISIEENSCTIDDVIGKWMDDSFQYILEISPNGSMYYHYLDYSSTLGGNTYIKEYTADGFTTYHEGTFLYSEENDERILQCIATDGIPKGAVLKYYTDQYSLEDLKNDWVNTTTGNHIIIGDNEFSFKDKNGGSSTDSVQRLVIIGNYLYDMRFGLLSIERTDDGLTLSSSQEVYIPLE